MPSDCLILRGALTRSPASSPDLSCAPGYEKARVALVVVTHLVSVAVLLDEKLHRDGFSDLLIFLTLWA